MARGVVLFLAGILVACDAGSRDGGETDGGSTDGSTSVGSEGSDDGPSTTPPSSTSGQDDSTGDGPSTSTGESSATDGSGESGGGTGEPEGVPVVVSLAHGGQTARSCDGGQTWSDFHQFGIQDDHSDYAAFGGLTFGNGAFVAATGWGADGRILRSSDGVSWEDLPDEAFVTAEGVQRPANGASGVEFVGSGFVLFAGPHMWRSEDGSSWTADTPETLQFSGHFREVEYLPGPDLLLIATEDYESQAWSVQVSGDGGATWQMGTGATSACVGYVQHDGGFAAYGDLLLLAGGVGPTCISDDGGLTWSEAGNVGADIADVESYDGGFAVLAQSGDVFVSADGQSWMLQGSSALDGGRFAWHEGLGFFGEGNGVYTHSADGAQWSAAGTMPPKGYAEVREFAVGYLATCP